MSKPDDEKSTDDTRHDDLMDVDGADAYDPFADAIDDGYGLMNSFNEEIENVSASDWNLDADALWGGVDDTPDFGPDPGVAFDFPI